ncbi:helix-turn-helix domain-containing protein [Isosphaeraceae bacterium EP7]
MVAIAPQRTRDHGPDHTPAGRARAPARPGPSLRRPPRHPPRPGPAGPRFRPAAARLGVSRSTVYNWAGRFAKERDPSPSLGDRPRAGRPPAARRAAEELAEAALGTDPRAAGYRHTNWTVPLLLAHLNRASGQQASGTTMRRALHGLGYRWKRPRFVLSRRSPTWRQAKGG